MHSFIKEIVIDDARFEAHFNEYYAPEGIRYFVFVKTPQANLCSFSMGMQSNRWTIINAPKVPDIIFENEQRFSDTIIECELNSSL